MNPSFEKSTVNVVRLVARLMTIPLIGLMVAFAINQGEGDWLQMLNYAVAKMHEDGTLTEMSKKWYNGLDLTVKE